MSVHVKKAQAAIEFLMTYGWAVLSVLAAIAILAYFGILSPEKLLPEKCIIDQGITCIGTKIESSQITLVLLNSAENRPITISNINVEGCSNSFNQEMVSGVKNTFLLDKSCSNGEQKDKFKGSIKINYFDKASGLEKTAYGSLNSRVE
ncbi:MAG: hypothetical protein AABX00_04615 [Nanoarchaeota archaeon]